MDLSDYLTKGRTLMEAIAKAYRWQACPGVPRRSFSEVGRSRKQTCLADRQVESGEYTGIKDLPQALGVDRTYVGRTLRLTSLAPDIIEAILRGDEPEGISLEKLRKNLPVNWQEQRAIWSANE